MEPVSSLIQFQSGQKRDIRPVKGFWSWFYRGLFKARGIRCGGGLKVFGPLCLQLEAPGSQVRIGNNVTLMPMAHLKVKHRGEIILHDGVKVDSAVRLVAARDARIEIGEDVSIGMGTIMNAGADISIGRKSLTAGYCYLNSSEHRFAAGAFITDQPGEHRPILIGRDVWLGGHVLVGWGSRIGDGAVIGAMSFVRGTVPDNGIAVGVPARVIRYRGEGTSPEKDESGS